MASQSIDTKDISEHARLLIKKLAEGILNERGIGSMSPAIYDTAWVSMISKPAAGGRRWLFPDSFEFILNTQTSEGGWDIDRSDLDSILNTLAALLAMKMHAANPSLTVDGLGHDIGSRISKATVFLGLKLEEWDVDTSRHVGFEILIPSLLENLKHEGISFDFPGRRSLMMLNRKKLANFDPEILYSTRKTTLIHSLEAFHGSNIVDYDRISHHKVFGSMMASPSSTAAYLMNSSIWDEEAESYIRTVIADGEGKGSGGVPSAFPCTIFEISWVCSHYTAIDGVGKLTKWQGRFYSARKRIFY